MKVQRREPPPPARERYGGARIAAAAAGAVSGAVLVALHLETSSPDPGAPLGLYRLGGAISGFCVGWRLIGMGLGRGWAAATMRGLTGAAAAALLFCLLGGVQKGLAALSVLRFREATELVHFMLQRALDLLGAVAESPAGLVTPAAAILVSLLAEALHRHWSWREPRADGAVVRRR